MYIRYKTTTLVIVLVISQLSLIYVNADDENEATVSNVTTDVKQEKQLAENESSSEEVKVAPNMDLKEVAPAPEPVVTSPNDDESKPVSKTKDSIKTGDLSESKEKKIETLENKILQGEKLVLLGAEVPHGTSTRLAWSPKVSISGLALPTPVLVINGAKPGPTLCLTGAIHGDELNGIEVVRRVMYDINPEEFNGTLIGVPIVNLQGFQRGSRYLSDRRDLNRFFPGEENGSLASRIANSLFTEVISHCEFLIDIHTGSLRRTNLPQIRANMSNPNVANFVEGFDKIAVVHHSGKPGMLRTAANDIGIISVTMELGESLRIQENQIAAGTHSVNSLLDKLEMYPRTFIWGDPKPEYYESTWIRVESGGILFSKLDLGASVTIGDVLGIVTDPITNQSAELTSPIRGQIIGMAVNQVVMPGFAAYHIGIESNQEELTKSDTEAAPEENPNAELDPE